MASVHPLRGYRAAKGISISRLAARLCIDKGTLSRWETGRFRIPAERVLEIERLTGVARHLLRPDIYPRDDYGVAA
jgi:DNA-binding transcriptional regulator YdaS (Cro superfamily)